MQLNVGAQSKFTRPIRVNQVGYLTHCAKLAVVKVGKVRHDKFYIKSPDLNFVYYEGTLRDSSYWASSADTVKRADFTEFNIVGKYVIEVPGLGHSYPFEIKPALYNDLCVDAIRYFYLNRASTDIPKQYGGEYARAAGHPDDQLIVHTSAATAQRPAGTKVSAPKGWYDAGDYGSYTTNASISTYTLMLSYDIYRSYFDTLKLNIPEGGNQIPDILDEVRWNLDWMLAMQDPSDNGVYFKKVSFNFPPFILPSQDQSARYLINKSTQSALDFTAVMSYASRLYRKYDPAYADKCLDAAKKAYEWAVANPNKMITRNTEDDFSGAYGDNNASDEFFWARAELYITTKEETYFPSVPNSFPLAGWPSVGILGCYSLLQYQDSLTQVGIDNLSKAKKIVLDRATERDVAYKNSAYKTFVLPGDFYWGSNSVVLNASMNHYFAYKLNNNKEYLDAMSHTFDYILGKNPLSISYVTKYGAYAPVSPHHRISGSLRKVLPGMVVGGPNPHNISDCTPSPYPLEYSYVSKLPALSYFDNTCSYSTNETAINWNAPLVFTVASLLKEYSCEGQSLEHVTFDSLSIKKNGCEVDIAFYTKNEQNVHSYIIEKSEDGRTFTKFAEVLNNHTGVYLFHDNNLGMKKVYYKVRAAEMLSDAILFTNSEIASVDFIADYLLVYPIPVDELLTIELPCYTSGSYKVHDTYGHFVSEGILPSPYNLIHVSSWRSGIYVFTINANGRTEKKRVMVK